MFFINPDKLRIICSVDMSEHRGFLMSLKHHMKIKTKILYSITTWYGLLFRS